MRCHYPLIVLLAVLLLPGLLSPARAADISGLVAQLTCGDSAKQVQAVIQLRNLYDARMVAPLLAAMKSPDAATRKAAVGVIGDNIYEMDRLIYTSENDDNPEIVKDGEALVALVGGRKIYTALFEALDDTAPEVRQTALSSLQYRVNTRDQAAIPHLLPLLKTDVGTRRDALVLLGQIRDRKATEAVRTLLNDNEKSVQQEAYRTLAKLGDMQSLPRLLTIALSHPDSSDERQFAADVSNALQEITDPAALEPIRDAMANTDPQVRVLLVQMLGRLQTPDSFDPLLVALHDPNATVRAAAIYALQYSINPDAREVLRVLARQEKNSAVRAPILQCLAQRNDPELITLALEAVKDPDAQVRGAGVYALAQLSDPRAHKAILQAAGDADPQVRVAAFSSLFDWHDPEAQARMTAALTGTDPALQNAAIVRWQFHPDATFVPLLLKMLNNTDAQTVTPTLIGALAYSGNTQGIEQIIALFRKGTISRSTISSSLPAMGGLGGEQADPRLLPLIADLLKPAVTTVASPNAGSLANPQDFLLNSSDLITVLARFSDAGVPLLCDMLGKGDRQTRLDAIQALGNIADMRATKALIPLLEDKDQSIRERTMWALTQIGDPRALPSFLTALHDSNREVKLAAITGLGKIPDPQATAALLDLLNTGWHNAAFRALKDSTDPRVREAMILAAANEKIGARALGEGLPRVDDPRVMKVLLTLAQHADANIRYQAINGLGRFNDLKVTQVLLAALNDPVDDPRHAAITALAGRDDPQVLAAFARLLKDGTLDDRRSVLMAMSWHNTPGCLPFLLPLLDDKDTSIRREAAKAVAEAGDVRGGNTLLAIFKEPTSFWRAEIIEKLSELKQADKFLPLFRTALEDADHGVRQAAVAALGKLHDRQSIKAVRRMLDDPDYLVNQCTVLSLAQLGDTEAVPLLIEKLRQGDFTVAGPLGQLKDPRAVEPILHALTTMCPWQFFPSMITALGELGDRRAVPVLCALATQFDCRMIHVAVAEALGKIGDPAAISTLTRMLADENPAPRQAAADALKKINGK